MKYKTPKETTLFNANHITIIKRDGIESTEVSVADNTNSTQVELGGTHNYFGKKEVYKKEKCVWARYSNGKWERNDVPILTHNFAGIGSRDLNENGKNAIRQVYVKTFEA